MTTENKHDSALYQAWLEQKEQYVEAIRLTDIIRKEFETDRNPETELEELNQIMVRISEADLQIKKMGLGNESSQSNPQFQQLIEELRTMVERLLSQVNLVEQLARDRREKMRPQISTHVKQRQMLSAYLQS